MKFKASRDPHGGIFNNLMPVCHSSESQYTLNLGFLKYITVRVRHQRHTS